MASEGVKRRLSAILSADVAGYSKLMEADEEATVRTIESYRKSVSSLVEQHNGRVVDSPGDNLLSEFGSVVDAVQCAVEIQHVMKAKNAMVPESRRMQFRIGISLEDVIDEDGRLYGDGVNIASRIEGLADPGGICISSSAYEQIKRKLALGFEDLGEYSVKNISWPVHVYRIPIDAGKESEAKVDAPDPVSEKPSVAVLPFDNMSGDPDQEYFADGMTEEIITRLSMNPLLTVIARNSTFYYKGKQTRILQIARELGVLYVVEGSVRKTGNRIRITAQLIDTATEGHLWAQTYDREYKDVFALQDEIAQQIVAALNVEYYEAEKARARRIPTRNMTAYDLLWRGAEYHEILREKAVQAKDFYEKAIRLDPGFASAYVYLGHIYRWAYVFQWDIHPQPLTEAGRCAEQAISLDSSDYNAHALMANIQMIKGQPEMAFAEAERALSLNPNDAATHNLMGSISNSVGRPEEAIEYLKKAILLDPHSGYEGTLQQSYHQLGRYREGITLLKKVLILKPNDISAYWRMAHSYNCLWLTQQDEGAQILDTSMEMAKKGLTLEEGSFLGRHALTFIYLWKRQYDEAIAEAERMISIAPGRSTGYDLLALMFSYIERPEEAVEMAEKAIQINPRSHTSLVHLGLAYRSLGRLEDAVTPQERVAAANPSHIIAFYAHMELSILCAELGRLEEARAEAGQVQRLAPNFSVGVYGHRVPYTDPATAERDMAALREAGLK